MISPLRPRILKGGFIHYDEQSPDGNFIIFQYNPGRIFRRLEAREKRFWNWLKIFHLSSSISPRETIIFTIVLDAADYLEDPETYPGVVESGIYPQLSALEMLLYPQSSPARNNSSLALKWPLNPREQPLTLFTWGKKRVIPVKVTELRIHEEMFDPLLNPIRATVKVTMQVLHGTDLRWGHKGYDYWVAHVSTKTAMAKVGQANRSVSHLDKI